MAEMDLHRVQVMRQQCNRIFRGKSVHDIVGALEMLTADVLEHGLGLSGVDALGAARAIAADVEGIIIERAGAKEKAH